MEIGGCKKIISFRDNHRKPSYYEAVFQKLLDEGVPHWFIRNHLLTVIIYHHEVNVHYNPYNIEAEDGWYSMNTDCKAFRTPADINRKSYGTLKNAGFPTWDEYGLLFDGSEWDQQYQFINAYDRHKEEWLEDYEKFLNKNRDKQDR